MIKETGFLFQYNKKDAIVPHIQKNLLAFWPVIFSFQFSIFNRSAAAQATRYNTKTPPLLSGLGNFLYAIRYNYMLFFTAAMYLCVPLFF